MGKRGPKPRRKEVIWSPEMAYAVGLLVTDGSLSVDGRHIDLTSRDLEQLHNFMYCIGRQIRISSKASGYKEKTVPRIQFSDVTLYDFLISIGLSPHKTKTIGAIKIPRHYFADFLRGHHDGDGCFYSYFDPRWKSSFMFYLTFLSSSPDHIRWLQKIIYQMTNVSGRVSMSTTSSVIQLRFAKREALILLRYMYPKQGVMCLSRKRLKIERGLRIVGESLPSGQKTQA